LGLLVADRITVTARIRERIIPAIESLSFSLPPGRILGLVGESGAGKSMIAKSIAQLMPPGFAIRSGSMSFDGEISPRWNRSAAAAYWVARSLSSRRTRSRR